jgi:invasion protein IalB
MTNRSDSQRRPFSGFTLVSLSTLLLLGLTAGAAWAQQATPADQTTANQKAPEPEVASRGQRPTIREIKYGDWRKVCFKTPGTNMVCRTTISGTWADTGRSAVRADLIEREGEGAPRLQIFLPVGLYLPAGVKITVDQGTPYRIPYVWCLSNTCIAGNVADPKLIQEMETGQKFSLEVVDANVLTISTILPLVQFAAARKHDPAQVFEQDVEE